jgi:hypothetical protein
MKNRETVRNHVRKRKTRMPKWVKRFSRPLLTAAVFGGIGALLSLGVSAAGST